MSSTAESRPGPCSIGTSASARSANFADGRLGLPKRTNRRDEAQVEVKFVLAMQFPYGISLAVLRRDGKAVFNTIDAGGLVHTKIADEH